VVAIATLIGKGRVGHVDPVDGLRRRHRQPFTRGIKPVKKERTVKKSIGSLEKTAVYKKENCDSKVGGLKKKCTGVRGHLLKIYALT